MNTFDTVVVIPIGTNSQIEFLIDTIESFIYNSHCAYKIILSDNSKNNISAQITERFSAIDVLRTRKNHKEICGEYVSLSHAYEYALNKYQFKLLLKLNTDALVIGDYPEKEAFKLFSNNPKIGLAGQYIQELEISQPDSALQIKSLKRRNIFRIPVGTYQIEKLYTRAKQNGYKSGENISGGAYFISRKFLHTLMVNNLLPNHNFANLQISENELFSLLAKAAGFEISNLVMPNVSAGEMHKAAPASPEELKKEGKKIIQSVRVWMNMSESDIRSYFQTDRVSKAYYIPEEPLLTSDYNG